MIHAYKKLSHLPGACLAAIIAAAFENPSLLPDLKIPEGHPPLKFCIAISGFRSRDPNHQALFEGKDGKGISTPVLSILGRSDQIVTEGEFLPSARRNGVKVASYSDRSAPHLHFVLQTGHKLFSIAVKSLGWSGTLVDT